MISISPAQFGMLTFVTRISLVIVRLPTLKLIPKGPDAWIAILLGSLFGNLMLWVLLRQAAVRPQFTPIERLQSAFGPVAGAIAGVCYLLLFLYDTMVSTRMYAGLLVSQPMPETPTEAFVFMLIFAAAYAAWKGPEVVARVGEFMTPLIFLGLAVVLVFGINQMDPRSLKPVLAYGWGQVLRAALFSTFVHVELAALLMFVPLVRDPRRMVRAGVLGSLSAGMVTVVAAACLIMFYGAPRTQRLVFPLYDMARAITFADFFERIDALFVFAWTAGSFIKVALLLWALAYGMGQLLGVKNWRALIRPLALLTGFVAMRVYANQAEVRILTSPQVYTFIALPFLVLFPLALALAEALRPGGRAQ
ncbi:MAG TPA: endospore germination permease [Symbiobacteriaceae bacterium]|nr:endospore germination permease [Symbiobacteriaceae bacterium]